MAVCLGRAACHEVKPADLVSRALVQSPLIRLLACFGTELHPPIAVDEETELPAAMVAARCHELRVHALIAGARWATVDTLTATP